jgi:hypothetical protein
MTEMGYEVLNDYIQVKKQREVHHIINCTEIEEATPQVI